MLSFVRLTAPLAPVNHDVHVIETKGTSVNVTVWHASQTNGPIRYESSYNPLKILYNCKQVHKEKIFFFFFFQRDDCHAISRQTERGLPKSVSRRKNVALANVYSSPSRAAL